MHEEGSDQFADSLRSTSSRATERGREYDATARGVERHGIYDGQGCLCNNLHTYPKCKRSTLRLMDKGHLQFTGMIGRARRISAAPSRGIIQSQDCNEKSKIRWLVRIPRRLGRTLDSGEHNA